jgi:diaminopimelate epimerase
MPAPVTNAFAKGHALGNDYLVVEPAHLSFALTSAMVRRLCDRHRGVGGDGVLALVPSAHADAGLRIYNPDGSEAEKSGNGLRIFARWLVENGRVTGDRFRVETPGGIVDCRVDREDGRIVEIAVDMGHASFRSDDVPCSGPSREVVAEPVEVAGTVLRVTAVGIGNPHCVVFVDDPATADLARLGPALEHHPLFPRRTNVQLARVVEPQRVRVRVWERGAGETLASGSSACAVAAACVRLGYTDRAITVVMDGGLLHLQVDDDYRIQLSGDATIVYRGALAAAFVTP